MAASALALVPKPAAPPSLYSAEEYLEALAECVTTVSPDQEEAFLTDFAKALATAQDKRDRVGAYLGFLESQVDHAKNEIKRLQARKAALEAAGEKLESYVVRIITAQGPDAKGGKYPKLEGKTVTFSVRKNPAKVDVLNESGVPLAYKSVTLTMPAPVWETILDGLDLDTYQRVQSSIEMQFGVEKKAIKAALDAGTLVPGTDYAPPSWGLVRK